MSRAAASARQGAGVSDAEPYRGEPLRLMRRFFEMNRDELPARIADKLEHALDNDDELTVAWVEGAITVSVDGDAFTAALEYGEPGLVELVVYADRAAAAEAQRA